jgi:hypothetical protein
MVYAYLLLSIIVFLYLGITIQPIIIVCVIPWILFWIMFFQKYGGIRSKSNRNHPIEVKVINGQTRLNNHLLTIKADIQLLLEKIKRNKKIYQAVIYILVIIVVTVCILLDQ